MSDFVLDNCTGTGDFDPRVPDTGDAWALFSDSLHGVNSTFGADTRPECVLGGDGTWSFNNTAAPDSNVLLVSSAPASADYAIEVVVQVTGTGDNGSWIGALGVRCIEGSTINGALQWEISSGQIQLSYDENGTTFPGFTGTDASAWINFTNGDILTIRMECEGRNFRGYLNDTKLVDITRSNGELDAAGTVAWGFRSFAVSLDTTKKVLSMRAGDLAAPPSDFWTDFVKTAETLS